MIPHDDIVAIRGSVSNHCDTKSTALMVMSWMKAARSSLGKARNARARERRGSHCLGSNPAGSGGTMDMMGLMNRTMSAMSWPNSSYASASRLDHRLRLATVLAWSFVIHR